MARCPSCGEWLLPDRERQGARCRACWDPLYEPPDAYDGRPGEADGLCAAHPQNAAEGSCKRCGNFFCALCRTRWRGQTLCTACVDRALESGEVAPEAVRAHFRQALTSLLLGIGAWGIAGLGFLFIVMAAADGMQMGLLALGGLVLMASPLPALVGVGFGAAAIRDRGNHLILATFGLILCALMVGVVIGLFCLGLWQMT